MGLATRRSGPARSRGIQSKVATVVCIAPLDLPPGLTVTMPGMGELAFIRESLEKTPRPSDMILKALNNLAPAMAPIHTALKIIAAVQALTDCMQAVRKAITQLSPAPLIKCFPDLVKALADLIPLIPPLAYVAMVVDIITLMRALVEDMLDFIERVDRRITAIKNLIARGETSNDTVLIGMGNCAKAKLNADMAGFMDIVGLLTKAIAAFLGILDAISSFLPGPAGKKFDEVKETITGVQSSIAGAEATDFPPLGFLQQMLSLIFNALVIAESAGNAVLGRAFEVPELALAELTNP